ALCKDCEFVVEAAESAAAALELVRVQSFELVISDTDLPDANGLRFYRALSQESRLRSIPFVFLSADRRPDARVAALRAGVADYLTKPCHPAELAARAVSLVERERRIRENARRRSYLLAGDLSAMSFPDLVNIIEMGQRSGVLSLVLASAVGQIFFARGRIVHAVYGNLVGPRAFHEFIAETAGTFEFAPGDCEIPDHEWTIRESATSLILEGARLLDERAHHAVTAPAPAVVAVAANAPDFEPPLAAEPGIANQLVAGIEDPFALAEMALWSPDDVARWTRRSVGTDRFHVHLIAELTAGVSAILPLCGAPGERWISGALDATRKAFGLSFFLRHERTVDLILIDVAQPDTFEAALARVPSLVILAPPSGDVMSLGIRARIALESMLRRLRPQVLLIVGNRSLQADGALRDLGRYAETVVFADGGLGESSDDLRGLLAQGIRAWGAMPIDTRVVSMIEETA
ncbi:MAG TPA: DUF4388 domain-containing protein, partial [Kofleriaceae bacterium]|nr:DUF4388 domain-containing protein [Kofleriaceae bacterium]